MIEFDPPLNLRDGWTPGELAVLRAADRAWERTRPRLAERLGLDGHPREQCEVEHAPGSRRCTHTAAIAITTGCTQGEHIGTTNACPCCARRIGADAQSGGLRCGNCGAARVVLKAEPLHGMQDDREELIG